MQELEVRTKIIFKMNTINQAPKLLGKTQQTKDSQCNLETEA